MFSLQKLLGHEDKLFPLLEASAEEARASVEALVKLSTDLARPSRNEEVAYVRHKGRQITDEITAAVYRSFTTAIERGDIQALSYALYRIPKTVEKFTERALIAPRYLKDVDFSTQINLLQSATDIVIQLVQSLRQGQALKQVKELNDELQALEREADRHMMAVYKDLFSGRYEAPRAIFLRDLCELLEKAIDRCRSAGNVIARIALKNS